MAALCCCTGAEPRLLLHHASLPRQSCATHQTAASAGPQVRTTLGPRGMDKLMHTERAVTVSNDGERDRQQCGSGHSGLQQGAVTLHARGLVCFEGTPCAALKTRLLLSLPSRPRCHHYEDPGHCAPSRQDAGGHQPGAGRRGGRQLCLVLRLCVELGWTVSGPP